MVVFLPLFTSRFILRLEKASFRIRVLEKDVLQITQLKFFCNQVAAEVLVPTDELSAIVNSHTLETDLPESSKHFSKHFRASPEVIMRRLLALDYISLQDYPVYRNDLLEKYQDSSVPPGGRAPYHNRLLNASGEHFARTAFAAYYEEKITLADLSDVFAKCDPKYLSEIESTIFA